MTLNNKNKRDWAEYNYDSFPMDQVQQPYYYQHIDNDFLINNDIRRRSVAVGEMHFHSFNNRYPELGEFPNNFLNSDELQSTNEFVSPDSLYLKHDEIFNQSIPFQSDFMQSFDNNNPNYLNTNLPFIDNQNYEAWTYEQPRKKKIASCSPSASPPTILYPEQNTLITNEQNEVVLKSLVDRYLHGCSEEKSIMIFTSKVAQKSYGTEKRFLCPPPITVLSGTNWLSHHDNTPPQLVVQILGEKTSQSGHIEWENPELGRCVSKQLHINDADEKRKRVHMLLKVDLANGQSLGTFPSSNIKVISKPSKKRQSVKNIELCIHHGTTISLFNRIRAQTVSTKYLGSAEIDSNICLVSKTDTWDPFVIWIVDIHRKDTDPVPYHPRLPPPPAIALRTEAPTAIRYNQLVVLQCVASGLVSPVMVIRKVDKGSFVLGGHRSSEMAGGEWGDESLGDPVSQLHKVAFQIVTNPQPYNPGQIGRLPTAGGPISYLVCQDHKVGMHQTNQHRELHDEPYSFSRKRHMSDTGLIVKSRRHPLLPDTQRKRQEQQEKADLGACWTEDASDAAIWTIVGTDCASFRFWNSMSSPVPVTPYPIVKDMIQKHGRLSFRGDHLTGNLTVWFGNIKSESEIQNENLESIIPSLIELMTSESCIIDKERNQRKIPILFVRTDGVLYNIERYFTF